MSLILRFLIRNIAEKKGRTILIILSVMLSSALFLATTGMSTTMKDIFAVRLERTRKLVDSGSVSAQDLSSLQAEYDALVYDRDASRWALSVSRGEAEMAASEEQRLIERFTDEYFDSNHLLCPFEKAVVAEIGQRAGGELEAGALLMVLHDTDSLLVEADLPEEFIRDVEIGSTAKIIPLADPRRSYAGTVIEIAGLAVLENGENVVKTRIRLEERDGFLREGFNVDVEI